jgi:small-conductance mechanosensitive channel
LLIAIRARNGTLDFFHRVHRDVSLAILLSRVAYVLVLLLGLLLILPVFDLNITAFFAALGIIGLAISLAIQDVLKNVFAGVYILLERPFRPGDVLKVRDFHGTVETIDIRTTTLRSEGHRILVPNAILLSEILVNQGAGLLSPREDSSESPAARTDDVSYAEPELPPGAPRGNGDSRAGGSPSSGQSTRQRNYEGKERS